MTTLVARWLLLLVTMAMATTGMGMEEDGDCPDTSGRCLKVFDHSPSSLAKCYCTRLCPQSLSRLASGCASNQLLADKCGTCLVCARALGQSCGGWRNSVGVCAGGLLCKVRVPADALDRRRAEQRATGVCVREEDRECARSTDTEEELLTKQLVACRPGLLGILAEALYCPDLGSGQCPTKGDDGGAGATSQRKTPTLLEVLLESPPPERPFRRGGGGQGRRKK